MRHQHNRLLQLHTGQHQTKSNYLRTLLTNLIKSGFVKTTPKRAAVLKSYADHFLHRLTTMKDLYTEPKSIDRESIRLIKSIIWTEEEGKKVMSDLLPKYTSEWKTYGFVSNYKLWFRKGDGVEEILVKLN